MCEGQLLYTPQFIKIVLNELLLFAILQVRYFLVFLVITIVTQIFKHLQ